MLISKKISLKDFVFYVIFQLIGATVACGLLFLFFGANSGFGANTISTNELLINTSVPTIIIGLVAEVVLTFTFIIAILGVTSRVQNKAVVGVVIGLTLTLVHLLGIYLTGTSVNPARSLIPALFAGGVALSQVWIFIVGPLVGSLIATFVYKFFLDKENPEENEEIESKTE